MATADIYNVRNIPGGDELIAELAGLMSEDYKASLRQAAASNRLNVFLQFPTAHEPELMSIGELARTAENENAEQFIDIRALRKVLVGRYGIARSTLKGVEACKLGLPIQVSYRKPPYTDDLLSPVISSGRHRLLAVQAILLAAGCSDKEVDAVLVRITTVVVQNDQQFSQLMENNNTSRNQSTHELKVHNLSSYGIPTSDLESMLEMVHKATTVSLQADFFAQAVALCTNGGCDPHFAFNVTKKAWNAVRKSFREDGTLSKEIYSDLFDGTKDLGELAEAIAKAIPGATRAAEQNELVRSLVNPVSRSLAHTLAKRLGVPAPGFPSPEEEAKVSLAKQQERVKQLEELLSKV